MQDELVLNQEYRVKGAWRNPSLVEIIGNSAVGLFAIIGLMFLVVFRLA